MVDIFLDLVIDPTEMRVREEPPEHYQQSSSLCMLEERSLHINMPVVVEGSHLAFIRTPSRETFTQLIRPNVYPDLVGQVGENVEGKAITRYDY